MQFVQTLGSANYDAGEPSPDHLRPEEYGVGVCEKDYGIFSPLYPNKKPSILLLLDSMLYTPEYMNHTESLQGLFDTFRKNSRTEGTKTIYDTFIPDETVTKLECIINDPEI